jgi:hypothetical protein
VQATAGAGGQQVADGIAAVGWGAGAAPTRLSPVADGGAGETGDEVRAEIAAAEVGTAERGVADAAAAAAGAGSLPAPYM